MNPCTVQHIIYLLPKYEYHMTCLDTLCRFTLYEHEPVFSPTTIYYHPVFDVDVTYPFAECDTDINCILQFFILFNVLFIIYVLRQFMS